MNPEFPLLPDDPHDRRLLDQVHPSDWVNPVPAPRYNLVVIGGGTAGLVSAMGAAGLGARVALVERQFLGGDCLVTGCVPSKALIAAARRAAASGEGDFSAAMDRLRRLRADIARHDSAARCRDAGVDVFLGHGQFLSSDAIAVGNQVLKFARAAVCTGARAAVPEIPGLREAGYLTNETVFNLRALPKRMLVLGAGPIGCELAQGFARFGAQVTLVEAGEHVLPREDPDVAAVLLARFEREGVQVCLRAQITGVTAANHEKRCVIRTPAGETDLAVDEILVATGRAANVEGLGLERGGIEFDAHGIRVDDTFRSTNPRVYAAGDVCMPMKFTHAADFAARAVIRNALFPFLSKARMSRMIVPWCTYTEPEVAHVGENERSAAARGLAIDSFTMRLDAVDRAILQGSSEGLVKIHCARGSGRIAGATIVAPSAGEIIAEMVVAMQHGVSLGALAGVMHPYPTVAEAIRKLGDEFNRRRLRPGLKRVLAAWLHCARRS